MYQRLGKFCGGFAGPRIVCKRVAVREPDRGPLDGFRKGDCMERDRNLLEHLMDGPLDELQ